MPLFVGARSCLPPWQRRWHLCFLALGLMFLCNASPTWSEELSEYQLKAAFLYNFAAFTEWPPQVAGTLNLCVYGRDPFGTELDVLNGKIVGTRMVVVQRKVNFDALKNCQIVFIPTANIDQLPQVLKVLRGVPVLTVTDSPGASRQGAALNMNLVQGRVRFEANLDTARGAQLGISSRLLLLATVVIQ